MARQTRAAQEREKQQWLAQFGHRPITVTVEENMTNSPSTWKVIVVINTPGPPGNDFTDELEFESQQRAEKVADYMITHFLRMGGNIKLKERPHHPRPGNSP